MVFAIALVLSFLSGCGRHDGERSSRETPTSRHLYSPNGEPLNGGPLGQPSCEEAMKRWFDRVDTNQDGVIDRNEYLADAGRQFAAMDIDKNGVITSDELSRYRATYDTASVPGPAADASQSSAQGAPNQRGAQRKQGGAQPRNSPSEGGRTKFDTDEPDPVMAADVHLQFKVTLADFLSYAEREFDELNGKHDGRLTKAETLTLCQSHQR